MPNDEDSPAEAASGLEDAVPVPGKRKRQTAHGARHRVAKKSRNSKEAEDSVL